MVSVVHSLKPSSGEAEVVERLCAGLPDAAGARAAEALALARPAYGDKQVGTGEAVLQHALGMALIVASLDLDADARVAALLFAASDHVQDCAGRLKVGYGDTVAGLVAGAMSMAAGEYVSVHSQADTEQADLARERDELEADPAAERRELALIYVGRGLQPELEQQVAAQLMAHDALGAHTRDELGITDTLGARPVQAALASAASFAVGAALPLGVSVVASMQGLIPWVSGTSLAFLAVLCGFAYKLKKEYWKDIH